MKPTKGWVPAAGVVPACRSQDVVTAMAKELSLAQHVVRIMAGPDDRDALSRSRRMGPSLPARPQVGVAPVEQLGELAPGWAEAYSAYAEAMARAGAVLVEVDVRPFLEVARMLYEGGFVAERYAAVGEFVDAHPDEVDPTVRAIIQGARSIPAWRLYQDFERLDRYKAVSRAAFGRIDALLLPTTVQHPTLEAVAADPIGVNSTLGRFTNFANLLDLAALAVPAGEVDGLPFGVQLVGPAFSDAMLASLAERGAQ